ncbi:MAG: chemotaxis protein CheW [Oceanobacter sp.]
MDLPRTDLPDVLPKVMPLMPDLEVAPSVEVNKSVDIAKSIEEVDEPVLSPKATEIELVQSQISEQASLDWRSSQGVDCLLFKVSGLKLAIPLPMLGGVYLAGDEITTLFGQARWSMGVWQGDAGKLTVVDSADLMMPERGRRLAEEGFDYLIQLDRSPWALACQEICDTVKLKSEAIKWSGENSKRPWLAGTVIEEMCALINVDGLMQLLEAQRRG